MFGFVKSGRLSPNKQVDFFEHVRRRRRKILIGFVIFGFIILNVILYVVTRS